MEPAQNEQGRYDPPQEPGLLKENDHGTAPQSVGGFTVRVEERTVVVVPPEVP